MSICTEWQLDSTDGKSRLHVMEWLPDDKNTIKAVLQLAHGIAEHIGRYDTFGRFMANNGFAVIGNSHLGHGQSALEEDRGFFSETDGWGTAVCDMRRVYDAARVKYPAVPYFLLGHSMGSFLTRTFLIRYPNLLNGCIISGTGQQTGILLDIGRAAASVERRFYGPKKKSASLNLLCFGAYNRRIQNHRTPCDWLTRDRDIVDKFIADDTCGFVPSIGLFNDLLGGIKFVGSQKNINKMQKDLPILFISGTEDPVGDYGAALKKIINRFNKAGISDVTLKMYEGARHEVLNETNKREVFSDVLNWMQSKM